MNLKKIGKVLTSKFVGTGPSSFEKRIYWAAVSQTLRNCGLQEYATWSPSTRPQPSELSNMKTSNLTKFGGTAVLLMLSTGSLKKMDGILNRYNLKITRRIYMLNLRTRNCK